MRWWLFGVLMFWVGAFVCAWLDSPRNERTWPTWVILSVTGATFLWLVWTGLLAVLMPDGPR